jgi:hypothetical protein
MNQYSNFEWLKIPTARILLGISHQYTSAMSINNIHQQYPSAISINHIHQQ